jgi:hypothetical protein
LRSVENDAILQIANFMEDNEQNRNLALQVLSLVSQGCMLKLVHPDLLLSVGYAEVWLPQDKMFYCELGDGETGHQHALDFDHFEARSNQVIFYNADGTICAGLAPYAEWPEVDLHAMQAQWAHWQKDKKALANCQEIAKEWRQTGSF